MDLDDHDQLQNDNGEIDVGGCVETWRKKKRIEREGGGGEIICCCQLIFCRGETVHMLMFKSSYRALTDCPKCSWNELFLPY